ncbi:MAG: MBOAT family protein, partial [Bacteroidales bacterium]|nr:MBOAT family protein [Bacteroidales bacterium]
NSPYKATNCAGFWKRWHISLSNWLKDYLYIPIGGNRNATAASWLILFGLMTAVALMAKTAWVTLLVTSLIGLMLALYLLFPKHRKEYVRNVNNMDTMLLGGLWHGASFNFITWGGLNGLGILTYKYWKKLGPWARSAAAALLFACTALCTHLWPSPALNMFAVAFALFFAGTALRYLIYALRRGKAVTWLDTAWNVLVTFTFISFTRLFFRSGSNLHPSEANEAAWRTAKQMINQIGSTWHGEQILPIVENYSPVFILFTIGMIVHWLPERLKRRYRLWFANMPLWLMLLAAVATVFVIQQFAAADLQPFIYFQF